MAENEEVDVHELLARINSNLDIGNEEEDNSINDEEFLENDVKGVEKKNEKEEEKMNELVEEKSFIKNNNENSEKKKTNKFTIVRNEAEKIEEKDKIIQNLESFQDVF